MKKPEQNVLYVLIRKVKKVSKLVDDLIHLLEIFFAEEDPKNYAPSEQDIRKIYDNSQQLKKEIAAFEKQILPQNLEKIKQQEYLSKVRHDLHNYVNAILGYSELAFEDFQEAKNQLFIEKFQQILNVVRSIVSSISEIKLEERPQNKIPEIPFTGELLSGLQAGKDLESEEYKAFKESFTILIVDDVEENCRILERFLHQLGFKTLLIAHDGLQALEILKEQKADLILLDIAMPRMNGIELLYHLREDIMRHDVMVLMITGWDTIENEIKCIKLGAVDILPKPFNVDILRVRIDSCVEKKWFANKEVLYRKQIEEDKLSYEKLLRSVFPPSIIEELVKTNRVQTREFKNVAVLFTDVVGFTAYCDTHSSEEIIKTIQEIAIICEEAAARHGLQKIKTIGDGFLAISGMLVKSQNPVLDCIACAEEILQKTATLEASLQLRAGIDYGSVIGGIVGHHQYLYDIWSDTVNTASRIQSLAEPSAIYLSQDAKRQVEGLCSFRALGKQEVKGKKPINIFLFQSYLRE